MRVGLNAGGWWFGFTGLLALALAITVADLAVQQVRSELARGVLTDATIRAALLDSEVARFRLLPLALRDDSDVVAALADEAGADLALNRKLEKLGRETGAAAIYVVGRDGVAIGASNWRMAHSFVGTDYRFRRYVTDAQRFGSASQFARGTVSGRPGLYLSRRTDGGGVVVVKLEFDRLEADWARAGGDTFVRDADGVVLVSSRPDWRFATWSMLSPARLAVVRREASLPMPALRHLVTPANAVTRSVATGQRDWTLTLSRPAGPAERAAGRLAGVGAAFVVLTLSGVTWSWRQRRRLMRRRTVELEQAVSTRTAELTREMEERAASEAKAADLREGLRQANRLATLGQITASVAHETAQPVAAIRTYAATSALLLEQGDAAAVKRNLDAIARLSDRIGTVTEELRGFARRRTGTVRAVPLVDVIDGALLMLREQFRAVSLSRSNVPVDLMVRGGRVRLEQVLVNVLQNALEAVRDRANPQIRMDLTMTSQKAIFSILDNGPGIDPAIAVRLFTPFVTSRAEGLGLGLVIAHDIMVEFGGALRHVPNEGGAMFEIEMLVA